MERDEIDRINDIVRNALLSMKYNCKKCQEEQQKIWDLLEKLDETTNQTD